MEKYFNELLRNSAANNGKILTWDSSFFEQVVEPSKFRFFTAFQAFGNDFNELLIII